MDNEALLYAAIYGISIDIAKHMLKRYEKDKLKKMLEEADNSIKNKIK